MLWLNAYNRDAVGLDSDNVPRMGVRVRMGGAFGDNSQSATPSPRPWTRNPVVVADGHVFVLPTDSRNLYVYDAGTGVEVRRLPTAPYGAADVLLGVKDGLAVLVSEHAVSGVPWRTAPAGKVPPDGSGYRVEQNVFGDPKGNDDVVRIVGRGCLTADSIFVTSTRQLIRIDWKGWRIPAVNGVFPANGSFQPGRQEPGNVLTTARDVIVAGQHGAYVFTELDLIRQRFEARIAAAPADPEPRVRYAEALLAAGQPDAAIEQVDAAFRVAAEGPADAHDLKPGPARQMIFANVLEFARRSANEGGASADAVGFTNQLFDRAAAAAATPVERARYALARGDAVAARKGAAAEAINLYQTVLADPVLREARTADDQTAGTSARLAIGKIADADRFAYGAVETAAAAALVKARAADDPEQLLAVADAYPNSQAGRDARETAINRLEASNRFAAAIVAGRQGFATTPPKKTDERATLLAAIAIDELALPDGLGPALDRFAAAARLAPNMSVGRDVVLPDGRTLHRPSFAEVIAPLRELQAAADVARLPTYGVGREVVDGNVRPYQRPLAAPSAVIPNVEALIHPLPTATRTDQLATWSPGGGFAVYPAGQTTPVVSLPLVDRQPISAAFVGRPAGGATTVPSANDGHWVVWTPAGLYAATADGKPGWQLSLVALGPAPDLLGGDPVYEAVRDNGDGPSGGDNDNVAVRMAANGGQVINFKGKRFVFRNGGWVPVAPPPVPAEAVAAPAEERVDRAVLAGRRLVVSTSAGRVFAVDPETGHVDWQAKLSPDRPVDELLANRRFVVARLDDTSGSQLAVVEAATGRLVGRRRFGAEGSPNQLFNAALSEDATLVFTLARQVMTIDLDDSWRTVPVEVPAPRSMPDAMGFAGLTQPEQLIVAGGRVIALYTSSGGGGPMVRGFDLSNTTEATRPLATGAVSTADGAGAGAVSLQLVGSQLFAVHSDGFRRYNLAGSEKDHAEGGSGSLMSRLGTPVQIKGFLIGSDYVMAVNRPNVDNGPAGAPVVTVLFLDRNPAPSSGVESDYEGAESGRIKPDGGTTDWAAVDGGFASLTGRHTLEFRPCKRAGPTTAPAGGAQ